LNKCLFRSVLPQSLNIVNLGMTNKNRIALGLSFGIIMGIFSAAQNLLIYDNHTTNQIIKSVVSGLVQGILAGVLFGWLIGLFANSRFFSRSTRIDPEAGETILFETPATYLNGFGVGGKLYLTGMRLVFKSHKLHFQNVKHSISLSDIKQVDRYKTLGILNNALLVTTTKGKKEKFVVEQVEEWVTLMSHKIAH
jgi:hypothetical protein